MITMNKFLLILIKAKKENIILLSKIIFILNMNFNNKKLIKRIDKL